MKFGNEFKAQMVQEWQQAYMNYDLLKSILKEITIYRQKNSITTTTSAPASRKNSLVRKVSLYRAFSGLASPRSRHSSFMRRDEDVILVGMVKQEGTEEERSQTMFMKASDQGGDKELLFFSKLDVEFNKVLSFYKSKVGEVVAEAEELTRQMDALIALRLKVKDTAKAPKKKDQEHQEHQEHEDAIVEEDENKSRDDLERPSSLDNVTINISHSWSPITTLKDLLVVDAGCSSEVQFTKDKLKKSEDLLLQAFVEFYKKLRILKNYGFMNQLALSKIMKKYDKITGRHASKSYLDMVDKSYLGSSDEVTRLIDKVESVFIKHFSNGNRGKGMTILRPKKRKERHRVSFFLGFLFGCSVALVVTIAVLIRSRNIIKSKGRTLYMENIFPLYSLFGLIALHLIMIGGNVFYWRRYRVNYQFIFGLKEGTELSYREVFLLSAGLSVLALAAVTSNLDMDMERKSQNFDTLPELVPLILLGILLLILFCPFNIIYRSTRFFVLRCLLHCFLAPFYKVTLPDFFFADQLTSQVQAIRSLLFYACYYIWGDFKKRDSSECRGSDVFHALLIVLAIIPYWMRFLQCIRRLVEEKDPMNALNGLKYFSIIVALIVRTLYEQKKGTILKVFAAITSAFATIFATYWDLVLDWGLLQRHSKNRWLRDKLIIPNKAVYFVAIVVNCVLRLAWMQTVLDFEETGFLHRKALISIVACLEIIRRGIWNFFRLENEHLNNVGKYRAFKSVPLPFNYEDGEKNA